MRLPISSSLQFKIKAACILFWMLLISSYSLLAADNKTSCDLQGMRTLFETRQNELSRIKAALDEMLNRQRLDKVPVESLFAIDVTDESQVKQQVQALREFKPRLFKEQYPGCVQLEKALSPAFERIQLAEKDINRLKLKFLKLPLKQRQTFLRLARLKDETKVLNSELKKEQSDALNEYRLAVESGEKAGQYLKTLDDTSTDGMQVGKKLASEIVKISSIQAKIANSKLELSQLYEKRISQFNEYQKIISSYSRTLSSRKKKAEIFKEYEKVISIWRIIINMGITTNGWFEFSVDDSQLDIPEKLVGDQFATVKDLYVDYNNSYKQLTEKNDELQLTLVNRRQKLIEIHYKLITNASSLRSDYIQLQIANDQVIIDPVNKAFWKDLISEVKVVPYRFLSIGLSRWVQFEHYLQEGVSGIITILQTMFVFIIFLFIPFIVFILIKRGSKLIDKIRKRIIYEKHASKIKIKLSLWLKMLNPYLPYLMVYISVVFIDFLLAGSLVQELSIILPYIKIFIIYRILILFFGSMLQKIVFRSRLKNIAQYETKIRKSAKIIGLYFLVGYTILYTAESTVGKALVYTIVEKIFIITGFTIFILMAFSWRIIITGVADVNFSSIFMKKIVEASRRLPGFLLVIPLLIIVIIKIFVMSITSRIFEIDLAKKFLARFIRKQMESAGAAIHATDIATLPEEYKQIFSLDVPGSLDLWIEPDSDDFNICNKIINEWIVGDTDETSLAIYGEKGIGKSSLLELLSNQDYQCRKIKVIVPPKITSHDSVIKYFEEILAINLKVDFSSIRKWDEDAEKTILFLDDAHNFFLASIGGFQGFKVFLDLINSGVEKIFVCATFNIHSWMYLNSVFGKNKYFRNILGMSPWSEDDIRDLIVKRNAKSDFTLVYDPVISASSLYSERDSLENSEKKFFRLLWEQSDGNPRTAIYSWLTCIKPRGKILDVGLPRDPVGEIFKDLQADVLFIYAAIVRHENLTSPEVVTVTSLSSGLVSYGLKIGIERGFLDKDKKGRYRANPGWHGTVIEYLRERNLLYVN